MRVRFTKMQGAGNDFVVLDATRAPLDLSAAQMKTLADRRFGVGADQILMIEPSGLAFRIAAGCQDHRHRRKSHQQQNGPMARTIGNKAGNWRIHAG